MRVAHISDTHLGRGAFQRIDPDTGINMREQSIYDNYLSSIDELIRLKPDLILHTGDLFDVVKPKNKAIVVAMEGFNRVSEAGIPVVIIAGNHSMVKTKSTTSPYELFAYSHPDIHCVYQFTYESFEIGDALVHAVPNMLHPGDYDDEYQKITPSPGHTNILMLHGLAPGINQRLNTFAEMEVSSTMINDPKIQYVALGHYHGQVRVSKSAIYSGSLEYLTYGERFDEKGGILYNGTYTSHIELPHNPMVVNDPIDCIGLSSSDITNAICHQLEDVTHDRRASMVHVELNNILPEQFSAIDFVSVGDAGGDLLHYHIKKNNRTISAEPIVYRELSTINYLDELERYLEATSLTPAEKEAVGTYGAQLIRGAL